jgi:PAP2 superfamily
LSLTRTTAASDRPDNIDSLSTTVSRDVNGSAGAAGSQNGSAGSSADGISPMPKRTHWWAELLVIAWLAFVYDAINNLAPLRRNVAIAHAQAVLNLERSLHLTPELTLDRWLAGHQTLGLLLSYYYDNAHFIVTFGVLGWLWWKRADLYPPLRNALVLVNVIGFAVFWLYPVAPPRMLHGFTDVVAASGAFGSWHTGSLASQANQYAAMPSLHIAWAVWCTLAIWQITRRPWVRVLAVLYPCVTAVAVLATGNHFLLDLVGGLVTLGASVAIAWLLSDLAKRIRQDAAGRGSLEAKTAHLDPRGACHKVVTKSKVR